MQEVLRRWQGDTHLAAVRGPDAIALLPTEERPAWTKLWTEAAALINIDPLNLR